MPTAGSTDGVEIAYRAVGEPPPNVLLMHGWAGSGNHFDETLKHLDLSRLRAITFDFRGHGDSGPSDVYGERKVRAVRVVLAPGPCPRPDPRCRSACR